MLNARNLKIRENLRAQELKSKRKKVISDGKSIIRLNIAEHIFMIAVFIALVMVVDIIFYNNFIYTFIFIPLLIPYRKIVSTEMILRKKKILRTQYMESLNAMANAIESGYSIEKSIGKAKGVVEILYGRDSLMYKELVRMEGRLRLGVTIEDVYSEFASRSRLKEAADLAGAVKITNRLGGNISDVLKTVSRQIRNEMTVEDEIEVLIASKKYEHLIMCIVPICMVLYMRIVASDMMKYLYSSISGRVIMSICLLVYMIAVYMGLVLLRKTKFD